MLIEEKVSRLKIRLESHEINDELLRTLLDAAGDEILMRCFPYNDCERDVPERYVAKQIEVALFLYNKRGAEGQTAHIENGINRAYENSAIPDSYFRGIIPQVGIL